MVSPAANPLRPMTAEERKVLGFREKRREAALAYLLGPGVLAVGSAFLLAGPPILIFGLLNSIFRWLPKAYLRTFQDELRIAAIVWTILWYAGVWGLGLWSWIKALGRLRLRWKDLRGGMVADERLSVDACLCVSHDTEGELQYFIRTPAGVALVKDDASELEHQQTDLGWAHRRLGRDPRQVAFLPRRIWIVSKAPLSGHVVSTSWEGDRIEPVEGIFRMMPADLWAGGDRVTFVPATWEEVVARLAKAENRLPPPAPLCRGCEYDLSSAMEDDFGEVKCPECGTNHPQDVISQAPQGGTQIEDSRARPA